MSNNKKDDEIKNNLNDDEAKQRIEKVRENFEIQYEEFKNKPKLHFPCFRSTFLTSELIKNF